MARSQFLTPVVIRPQPGKKDGEHMRNSPGAYHQHGVGISMATRAAGARMPAVLQPFLRTPATLVTGLRRLEGPRRGLNIHRTSFCRFVPEHAEKLCRSTVQNRFIQSRLGRCTIRPPARKLQALQGLGYKGFVRCLQAPDFSLCQWNRQFWRLIP